MWCEGVWCVGECVVCLTCSPAMGSKVSPLNQCMTGSGSPSPEQSNVTSLDPTGTLTVATELPNRVGGPA